MDSEERGDESRAARARTVTSRAQREAELAIAQLEAIIQHAPVGMAFVDRETRFVQLNEKLAAINDLQVADLVGRRLDEIGEVRDSDVPAVIRDVVRTGESRFDVAYVGRSATGREVRTTADYYPVRGPDGEIAGVGIVVRETGAERQRDILLSRVTRLQELTAALAATGSVDGVAEAAVEYAQHAVGADAASFCVLDGETVRIVASSGYDHEATEWAEFSVLADVPIAEAIRNLETVAVATRTAIADRWPQLAASFNFSESTSIAAVPLRDEHGAFGAIGLGFTRRRTFDPDEVSYLVAVATQCATAYQRAVAFESEREARRVAEALSERLGYLAESSAVLSESLDPQATMQRLAELAAPTLADWCAVHLVQGDVAVPIAMASDDPTTTAMVRDMSERHPIPLDAPAGLGAVVRTGEPVIVRSVTMDAVRASTDEGELVDLLSRLRSIAIVPMVFHGRVLGTVTLSNTTDRRLGDEEVGLARDLAARAAQAVSNAQLYQERARVAATLQASLLPRSPTTIPGVDVATRFVPSSEGLEVGGDFYDVFRMGTVADPAPTWALVIGDVRGKGADAAAITGIARATVRAAALDERSPAAMLSRLNQVLLAAAEDDPTVVETGEPRFCTACVATVTPTERGADVVIAVGGHPPPYVLRAGGEIAEVGGPGGLIGVFETPGITDAHVHLGPGDSLVLYTDGITERHAGRMFFDEEGLVDCLRSCVGLDAESSAERIEVAARGFVADDPKDDLALIVARVAPSSATGTASRTELPGDERAAALARRFVGETLDPLPPGKTVWFELPI